MILDQHKLIFVHIPKTAGMSIAKSFGQKWSLDSHRLAPYYSNHKYSDYQKFAIIRNPYSRLVSTYNYIKSKPYYDGKRICGPQGRLLPFGSWLVYNMERFEGIFKKSNVQASQKNRFKRGSSFWLCPQYYWIYDEENKLHVSKYLKIENLNTEFESYMDELEIQVKLLHVNRTNSKLNVHSYRDYYDDYLVSLVASFYRIDLITFDYSF